jgi:hypothetical protein
VDSIITENYSVASVIPDVSCAFILTGCIASGGVAPLPEKQLTAGGVKIADQQEC